MDTLTLLEDVQAIARTGLNYASNPYDIERYERLLALVADFYGKTLAVPPEQLKERFSRELGQITPKVGADAAIFDDEGRILLQLRADDERWCLPCGWVETNEAPIDAAVREVREETSLEVRPVQLVGAFSRKASVEYGPHSMVAVVFLCEVTGGELQKSHEGLDLRYWRIEDVPVWHANHRIYAEAAFQMWQERAQKSVDQS